MIILSDQDKAFSSLSYKARLHLGLIKAQTDYERLIEAIKYNEPSLVKFYLDAGVSANSPDGSITSPIFYATVHNNPLIVKMLLDYGANPYFEHQLTHLTIIGRIFHDYDQLMARHFDYPIVIDKLNKLVMIAAIMQNAGIRFDTLNSKNESPLDKFGLWVGPERKEQVLAELLEKINHADINSIRSTDVIAQSPETIIRFSAEEEQQIALFRAGRYTEILNDRDDFSFSMRTASNIFNHRQRSQLQPSGSRTTIQDRIRRYTPRSIYDLVPPTIDNSSRIAEARAESNFGDSCTPLAATEHVEDIDETAEILISAERYLNSVDMYHTVTGERFRMPVTSSIEEPTRPYIIAASMGFFPDVPRASVSSLQEDSEMNDLNP